jgi:tetratricopeptide (TPR) repeat protein
MIAKKAESARQNLPQTRVSHPPAAAAAIGLRKGLLCWIIPVAIVFITAAAFFPVLHNQFVNLDDPDSLLGNPYYRGLGWTQLRWMFTTLHNTLYRPITWITLGADYLLWGMQPFGYHLTSLLLHCTNAVLVYQLAFHLFLLPAPIPTVHSEPTLRVAAAVAALVFAIHPLRVEPVAWASARNDVVAGLFFIGTFICYVRAVSIAARGHARGWMGAAIVVFALSLLSKPSGLALPFVLAVLDVYPLRRLGGGPDKWFGPAARRIWWEKVPFILLSLGAGLLALIGKEQSKLLVPLGQYGLMERGMQSICAFAFYLWKTTVPLALSPLYELPVQMKISDASFWLSATVVIGLTLALFILRRRWPAAIVSWFSYLLIQLPVTGLVQNGPQIAADRYSYLSCLPWAILAGVALLSCWQAWLRKRVESPLFYLAGGMAGLALVILAVLTWRQSRVWRDAEALWQQAVAVDQRSFFAHQFLGIALLDLERTDEALKHLRVALEISPNRASAHNNLANALATRGDVEGATRHYYEAIELDPSAADAHYNLARLLAKSGEQTEALSHYHQALQLAPDDAETLNNLALLLAVRGEIDEALKYLRRAVRANPSYPQAFYNLGRILAGQGNYVEAISNHQQALKLNPNQAEIHFELGKALAGQGQMEEAEQHFRSAIKLKTNFSAAQVALARLLALQGKTDTAAQYQSEAQQMLPPQSPRIDQR